MEYRKHQPALMVGLVGCLMSAALGLLAWGDDRSEPTARSYRVEISDEELESWFRTRAGAPFLRGQSAVDGLILTRSFSDEALRLGIDLEPRTRIDLERLRGRAALARLKNRLAEDIHVSDAEIDQELERRPARSLPKRWRLRNLFLRFGSEEPEAVRERLRVLRQRVIDGASFEELAREFSQSETRWTGGLLGNVRLGTFPPAVDEQIRSLGPGEISEILESDGGVNLLYCERVLPAVSRTTEQIREAASKRLVRRSYEARQKDLWKTLIEKAAAQILDGPDGPAVRFLGGYLDPPTLAHVIGEKAVAGVSESWPQAWHNALEHFVRGRMALLYEAESGLGPTAETRSALRWEERRILASAMLARLVDARFQEPMEADLRRAFEAVPEAYRYPETYHLEVLRLPRSENNTAVDILARIREGALSFSQAAERYSQHPSASRHGRLDGIPKERLAGRLGIDVARAVRGLAIGEISELVWDESSVWILRISSLDPERPATYDEARGDVRRSWIQDRLERIQEEVIAQRLEDLEIR